MSTHDDDKQQRREFAAQLRLLAQQVETGQIDCIAIATYAPCPRPDCNERHAGRAVFCDSSDLVPLLGAVKLLETGLMARYAFVQVPANALRPVPGREH